MVFDPDVVEPTLEGNVLWEVNGSMLPGNSVLGIAATWRHHLMEGSDAVARLKLIHLVANCLDNAGNVITLVSRSIQPFWEFPGTGRSALSCHRRHQPRGTYQSFGLVPLTTTLIKTSSGRGVGMAVSTIWTEGPLCTRASFMLGIPMLVVLANLQGGHTGNLDRYRQ